MVYLNIKKILQSCESYEEDSRWFQTTDFWSKQTSILTLAIDVTNIVTSISESAVSLCVKLKQSLYLDEIKGTVSRILAPIEALNGGYETQ